MVVRHQSRPAFRQKIGAGFVGPTSQRRRRRARALRKAVDVVVVDVDVDIDRGGAKLLHDWVSLSRSHFPLLLSSCDVSM